MCTGGSLGPRVQEVGEGIFHIPGIVRELPNVSLCSPNLGSHLLLQEVEGRIHALLVLQEQRPKVVPVKLLCTLLGLKPNQEAQLAVVVPRKQLYPTAPSNEGKCVSARCSA